MKIVFLLFAASSVLALGGNENSATTVPSFGWEQSKLHVAGCARRKLIYPLIPHVTGADQSTRFFSRTKFPPALGLSDRGELYGILDEGTHELRIESQHDNMKSTVTLKLSVVECDVRE